MASAVTDALLRKVVDYAGTFPPARLSVAEAVDAYARARAGSHEWLLGAFVIASDRLGELAAAGAGAWPISIVMNRCSAADVKQAVSAARQWRDLALELPPATASEIRDVIAAAPAHTKLFVEVTSETELEGQLDTIAAAGAFAKIRTGGTTASVFPTTSFIYRFLRSCADRRLACKATAGLHHAVAGIYPLTYEANSPTATMYGFLNLCLAAMLVHRRAPESDVTAALRERSMEAIDMDNAALTWHEHRMTLADAVETRRDLFRSFGSCSVQEPIDDLKRMKLA